MSKKLNIVAIDGPSGVGKSTVSRKVAAATGFTYLDTGAMYRAVGLFLQRCGVDLHNDKALACAMKNLDLRLIPTTSDQGDVGVLVNGEDVSDTIRTPEMAMIASRVSAVPLVREILTEMQRGCGRIGKVVAEGRDIGTVVFPDAAHKFFLDARPEERARRRVEQLKKNGVAANLQQILELTLERDQNDRNRPIAPLKQANDALLIDTTEITLEAVVSRILGEIKAYPAPTEDEAG
jgi:CMP/dCMP kinase